MVLVLFAVILVLALLFAFSNGLINGGGLASAVISTRAMEPFPALLLVGACQIIGLFLFGHAVSRTLTHQLVAFPDELPKLARLWIVMTSLVGALIWNFRAGRAGLPSSSTHAMVGGLAGSLVACFGFQSLDWNVFGRIFFLLGLVPACGIVLSFLMTRVVYGLGGYLTPAVGLWLKRLQIGAFAGAALGHGNNDGQKSVAMILLALPALDRSSAADAIPLWLLLGSGVAMAAGALLGSKATIQKVGQGFYRLQQVQGACVESSAMVLIGLSSWAGYPMSTSHVVTSSVLGTGMAIRPRSIRWTPVIDMLTAWLFTLPAAALVSGLLMKGLIWCHVVP